MTVLIDLKRVTVLNNNSHMLKGVCVRGDVCMCL